MLLSIQTSLNLVSNPPSSQVEHLVLHCLKKQHVRILLQNKQNT